MIRERWHGIQDPDARFLHKRLYSSLEGTFAREPVRMAYDGLLWAVRAGTVQNATNPSLEGVPLTLRRGIHVPALFRADVSMPGVHESYYEYSPNGGYNIAKNGTLGAEVYKGQYVSMHDMVTHMQYDPGLTAAAAANITLAHCMENPEDSLPMEVLIQMSPSDPDVPPPRVA